MTRDALVIGINSYPELSDLPKPAQDAEAIAQLLEEHGGFRVRRVPEVNREGRLWVYEGAEVRCKEVEEAIATLFNPDGDEAQVPDTALLFFAGHGLRKVRGGVSEGFLAASDCDPEEEIWGVSLQWLRRLLQKSSVKQQIIWLDCCHSGELHNFDEADPGHLGQGRDRCFIAACRPFESAYESLSGKHGVLTQFLLEGLDPSEQAEGEVTNHVLVDLIKEKVRGIPQAPIYSNSGDSILLTSRDRKQVQPVREGVCPYRGLRYFDVKEEDAQYFYGRTERIDELIETVKTSKFLAVVGPSGSGKSSLVRAGLLHQLKAGRNASGTERWKIYPPFTPGEQDKTPLENLARIFVDAEGELSVIERASQLQKAEELIAAGSQGLQRLIEATEAPRVVLVIDQFEEIFTLVPDESERQQFFECLFGALEALGGKLCLILVMRADFLGKCAEKEYFGLTEYINQNQYLVPTLNASELKDAIRKPAKKVGLEVEEGLVKQMIEDVQGSPGSLPLLQYTLTELWHQKMVGRLTLSDYNRLGGVKGALQKQADSFLAALSKPERTLAKRIFLELTQLGEGTDDTRRRVLKNELITGEYSEEMIDNILDKLVQARLVVTDELKARGAGDDSRVTVVDVAHESLIRHWPQLKGWLDENRDMLRRKRDIEEATRKWVRRGKPREREEVLVGIDLNLAENFLVNYPEEISSDAIYLIKISQETRDREIKQKEERERREREYLKKNNQKLRRLWLATAFFAIIFGLTALVAFYLRSLAQERENIAKSVQLAIASEVSLNTDPTRSLLLAIHAKLTKNTPQANLALWNAFVNSHERFYLVGHESEILHAEFDVNNPKRLLTASRDKTVQIFNLDDIENPIILRGHQDRIPYATFNPHNSDQILTVSYDGTAKIWDLNTLQSIVSFDKHNAPINYGQFDPHKPGRIVTVGSDNTAQVWEVSNPDVSTTLTGHQRDIWMAEFDPHEFNRILTVSSDSTARVWDLSDIDSPVILRGHNGEVLYGRFDPNQPDRLLTASTDRTARLWDLNNPNQPFIISGHTGTVKGGDFDINNSNQILTVSEDGTAKVWNLEDLENSITFSEHTQAVVYGQFSRDESNQILTVSKDGTAKIWKISDNNTPILQATLKGHQSGLNMGVFNPQNSRQILTIGQDATARIWELDQKSVFELPDNQRTIVKTGFSNLNHQEIFTINRDSVITLWNIRDSDAKQIYNLQTGLDSLTYANFYPGSMSQVITLDIQGVFQGWDLRNLNNSVWNLTPEDNKPLLGGISPINQNHVFAIEDNGAVTIRHINRPEQNPSVISVHPNSIGFVDFHPQDSNKVLTSSDDGIVRLWSLQDTFRPLQEIIVTSEPLWFSRFDPNNNNRLLTGGNDKVVSLLHLDDLGNLIRLRGHKDIVAYGEFDPDNPRRFLTASHDNTVRVWDLSIPNNPLIINGFESDVIYAGFSPHDSNYIIALTDDSQIKVYVTGGPDLVNLALQSLSRCLTSEEKSFYNIDNRITTQTLKSYFNKHTYSHDYHSCIKPR
ncbi:caspase family protein [Sodalinema gerasimenkoae]|uniref:nSTAND1 domain-containing NTPase n=1 Tax=Sodalinema gerasimenkoae TaxID=2862348 RepID=UPI00135A21D2|nr:caspase family protein [Sodalinema gerasimenkoae]